MNPSWRRRALPALAVCLWLTTGGCVAHVHRVGLGPNHVGSDSMRQYYLLFGLLPLNEVDSQRLTRDLTSYEIITEYSFVDLVLSPFLLPFTVTTRTVTVNR